MAVLIQLMAYANPQNNVDVVLELPAEPTDASEKNSTWQIKTLGYLSFRGGECIAQAFKKAYVDGLLLVARMPAKSIQGSPNELVYGVSLWGFFGVDGGIRAEGEGFIAPRFGQKLSGLIKWAVAPGQQYKPSLEDQPRGDFLTPSERIRNTA